MDLQIGQAIQYEWFRKDGMDLVGFIVNGESLID